MLSRRSFLAMLAASGALPGLSISQAAAADPARVQLGSAAPFSRDALLAQVEALAAADYVEPPVVPDAWKNLSYDQYRGFLFKHTAALWRDTPRPFEMEFFAPGLYFPNPVEVFVVDGEAARPVLFDKNVFTVTDNVPDLPPAGDGEALGYSGLRLNALLGNAENKSEFAVFQGASYFRAIAEGQNYGLSARGLAIDTADPEGEEFPAFRAFYVEQPEPGEDRVVLHAVMDSPSVAGLYTIDIRPGSPTVMHIDATIIPRREIGHVGIAPQTSMFLFDQTNRNKFDDYRRAVHDSDGLLIFNGAGEQLWRPLANPSGVQVSSFFDTDPRGFGLMQRPRNVDDFYDLEAHYHRRPGLWVTPGEGWGRGAITLVEIPADKEIYDNIVAYWRPRDPLPAGQPHRMSYRLDWCEEAPVEGDRARVMNTAMGQRIFETGRVAVVEFTGGVTQGGTIDDLSVHVSTNTGTVSEGVLQANPMMGGVRLAFTYDPGDARSMELRAQLLKDGAPVSEVWLYRWTAA